MAVLNVEKPGPSGVKIGDQSANNVSGGENIVSVKKGTIFMDLSVLFGVFDVLKCTECGSNTNSHIDMEKNIFSTASF